MTTPLPEGLYADLSDGMRLHYHDLKKQGQESGQPVIFIQGSGPGASGWSNFKHNIDAFIDAGYRVLVIDVPGYGFTSKPEDAIYNLDYFVNYLNEWLESLDISNCTLVGNSLGGAISLGFALQHPQKVSHLILMAPGGLEDRETYFATEGIQTMVKYPMGSPEFTIDVLRELLKLLVFNPVHVTEQLVQERWQILQIQNSQVLASMDIPNLTDRLHEIRCPVLGFWGSEDKFCPMISAGKIVTQCANARMILSSQCGHWVMVEQAGYFNRQCLDFLASHSQTKLR